METTRLPLLNIEDTRMDDLQSILDYPMEEEIEAKLLVTTQVTSDYMHVYLYVCPVYTLRGVGHRKSRLDSCREFIQEVLQDVKIVEFSEVNHRFLCSLPLVEDRNTRPEVHRARAFATTLTEALIDRITFMEVEVVDRDFWDSY